MRNQNGKEHAHLHVIKGCLLSNLRRGDWGNRRALGEDEMGTREKGKSSTARVEA